MPSIIVRTGAQEGLYLPLGRGTKVIGRDPAAAFQIDDDGVSRKHMQIRFDTKTSEFYATDMRSRNGTWVKGNRIEGEVRLHDGDEIIVGSTKLVFTDGTPTDKANALDVLKQVGERGRSTMDMR